MKGNIGTENDNPMQSMEGPMHLQSNGTKKHVWTLQHGTQDIDTTQTWEDQATHHKIERKKQIKEQ